MSKQNNPANDIMNLIGALAEMAHQFYNSMIDSGASVPEASAGMQAFITAWWRDMMDAARKEKNSQSEEE